MTQEELVDVKKAMKKLADTGEELWLENVFLSSLIVSERLRSESELNSMLKKARKDPKLRRRLEKQFGSFDQYLAETGLSDWLANLDEKSERAS